VHVGEVSTPPASVTQAVYAVSLENKAAALLRLLSGKLVKRTIVFTRTKSRADRINKMLARNGIRAVAIHGNRSQNQRNAALAGFRGRVYNVLVATDIAARGLDIPDVSHVINFDLPETPDAYIHRIGRTARMGKPGIALNLVTPEDGISLRAIERTLGARIERTKIEGIEVPEMTVHKQRTIARMPAMPHRASVRSRESNFPSGKKSLAFGER
jgi:ATP-dependent RNA helicase RhlE